MDAAKDLYWGVSLLAIVYVNIIVISAIETAPERCGFRYHRECVVVIMLLKEYRVCMPLTVDEVRYYVYNLCVSGYLLFCTSGYPSIIPSFLQYRIGQLYMIAKHSANESRGGEGVEVVVNEPCHDPVHGDGQFTEKRIYLAG